MKDKQIHSREYLTGLLRRRSVIALCSSILTLMVSFYGTVAGVIRTVEYLGLNGFVSFRYYTMLANSLAALSAAFVLPYAIEGVGARRFALPAWVARMHYLSTCSITIMMVFVLAFMSWASPEDAFGGANLFTHVFCPALILLSFFQVENGTVYAVKDWLIGAAPFGVYTVVYLVEVFVLGESKGGWPDIYRIGEYVSPALSIPLMLLYGFGVSAFIAFLSNRLTRSRQKKMLQYWTEDLDPVEVKVEAYALGRMAGFQAAKNRDSFPFNILEYLAERYHLDPKDLAKPYTTGFLNGWKERQDGDAAD